MRIAFLLESFTGGGVERNTLVLTSMLAAEGHSVSLVVCQNKGPLKDRLDPAVQLKVLDAGSMMQGRLLALKADPSAFSRMLLPVLVAAQPPKPLRYLAALSSYLREKSPDAVVAATPHINLLAVWGKILSGVETRLVLGERIQIRHYLKQRTGWRHRFVLPLMGKTYVHADSILAVSNGVADELSDAAGIDRRLIRTVYNPVVVDTLLKGKSEPVQHPWFEPGQPPVILSVGRLSEQKDYPMLIDAFAKARQQRDARLVILGEAGNPKKTGKRQAELMNIARALGVADDVDLPGFDSNPYKYMSASAAFALSSTYEGLPTVLIEAMACGCPVASTDNPGAVEILENGKWGEVVPVGDANAMSEALLRLLDGKWSGEFVSQRAAEFTGAKAVKNYESILS